MDSNENFNKNEESHSTLSNYLIYLICFGCAISLLFKCFKRDKKRKKKSNYNNIIHSPYQNNINNISQNNEIINNHYKENNLNNYNNNKFYQFNMPTNYNNSYNFNNYQNSYSTNYNNINNSSNENKNYNNFNNYNIKSRDKINKYNNINNNTSSRIIDNNNINIIKESKPVIKERENYLGERINPNKLSKKRKRDKKERFMMNNISLENNNKDFNDKTNNNICNQNELELIDSIGYISAKINEEPKIGLNNIGATCYMNATLQCLSHNIKLTNYFLSPKHENFIKSDENILSKSYLEILKRLWIKQYNNNKSNYSPNDFKEKISQMDSLFKGVAANDSKDLINFILQQLHSELNKNKYKNNNIINNNFMNINQNNEQEVLKYFLNDYQKNHCSIISDLFYGVIETKTECLQCKQRNQINGIFDPLYSYNFQIFSFLIFPLEEVRKLKSEINNFYYNEVNLEDCFYYYEKEEIMQGDNQMWCKYCRENTQSKYCTIIYSSPEHFIIILNRGKGNIFNVKLNFKEIIDISKFVCIKMSQNLIYQLYAIVTHLGPSSMSGHFIAFCKSPIDNMWYKYDDSLVDMIGKNFNDIHDFGCPYILFYERQGL